MALVRSESMLPWDQPLMCTATVAPLATETPRGAEAGQGAGVGGAENAAR